MNITKLQVGTRGSIGTGRYNRCCRLLSVPLGAPAASTRGENKTMKIVDVRATTIAVPLEAPLRHSNGVHWGRFVRTIVQVFTDTGLVGLGELGSGGESAELAIRGLESYVLGHDPLQLEALRWKIANPTASLYNNRQQLLAALE